MLNFSFSVFYRPEIDLTLVNTRLLLLNIEVGEGISYV